MSSKQNKTYFLPKSDKSPPPKKTKLDKTEDNWLVHAAEVYSNSWGGERVVNERIVGSFSSKAEAIENGKSALSSMSMCEDLFDQNGRMKTADETDCWAWVEDTSARVGEEGGVIFKVEGDIGDERYVRITRVSVDQPIEVNEPDKDEFIDLTVEKTELKISSKVKGKPTKDIWLLEEIKYDYYEHKSELHVKSLLGLFSNKTAATKNAKEAFANKYKQYIHITSQKLPCKDLFGSDGKMKKVEETGWKDAGRQGDGHLATTTIDNSDNLGESGGLLYKVEYTRYMYEVSVTKTTLDTYLETSRNIWLVLEARLDDRDDDDDVDDFYYNQKKIIGIFASKSNAMTNAKEAFNKNYKEYVYIMKRNAKSGMVSYEKMKKLEEPGWENSVSTRTDNSAKFGGSAGLLYKVAFVDGYTYEVSIEKTAMDKPIEKRDFDKEGRKIDDSDGKIDYRDFIPKTWMYALDQTVEC